MFKKMKLASKMIFGFGIPLIITACIVVGIYTISKGVESKALLVKDESSVFAGIARQMKLDVVQVQQWLTDISATRAQDGLDDGFKEAEKSSISFLDGLGKFRRMYEEENDIQGIQRLKVLKEAFQKYYETGKTMSNAYIESGPAEGNKVMASFDTAASDLTDSLEPFVNQQVNELDTAMGEIVSSSGFLRLSVLIAGVIAVTLGILIAWTIILSITRPINRIIDGLKEGSDQVASASGQISSASQSLAEGSSEQAASIEETASSLEEMSSMTRQNAENAGQADNLTKDSNQVVTKANESMIELITSMNDISKASEETSKIIKTIDEIAFQTNLLALNAAVEAARAGEAGAGFAVVADEVRNLAMRAADAAKNTAELIEDTVKKTTGGTELVDKTNGEFSEVADSGVKIGELISEIAAASNEQANGIEQVNLAVTEMDKVVQQNAATAEESASASEEMSAQAEQMKGMVDELLSIVNGDGHGASRVYLPAKRISSAETHQGSKVLTPGARGKVLAARGAEEVKPHQVIPMGDEDFKDF